MANPEFQFNFKFNLHKSVIPIGLRDDDYESLAVAYGVPLEEMMAEADADRLSNQNEAKLLSDAFQSAKSVLKGKRIAFLGDSISSDRRSFVNIIRTAVGEEDTRFLDDSVSAYKLIDIITNYYPRVTDFQPDIVHLMIGTNDLKRTTDPMALQLVKPEEYRRELEYLLKVFNMRGIKVIASTLPPVDDEKVRAAYWDCNACYLQEDRDAYIRVLREEVAKAKCILNDMEAIYARYSTDELTIYDGLHLNALGQRLMAHAVISKLIEALG